MFRAICFTCLACDFQPRCALENAGSEQNRLQKICRIIASCDFGIHDLSRTELNSSRLPRFNMPFELGLFLGAIQFGKEMVGRKSALILDREKYRYKEFLSDISGQDVEPHGGSPDATIEKTRNWLATVTGRKLPGPIHLRFLYRQLCNELPIMAAATGFQEERLAYVDLMHLMRHWLRLQRLAEER